ncbi:MAG TPA: RNA-directed DNA polymerase, partial [Planctomycetaceae bacterium]|nr:RNA-directed DNA polymerase [Planctomycetaceae bacterium]
LRYRPVESRAEAAIPVDGLPYRFARLATRPGQYWDLSRDGDPEQLGTLGLPEFHTPEQLADWLQMPIGRLAWLTRRGTETERPETERDGHYFCRWMKKRSGGWRLIETPKPLLKSVQQRIAREILQHIPPHEAAHGFVRGRSIVTNARPHVGRRVVLKLDLENFYASVHFARVVAIFRRVGYSREAAIWLARLTTSAAPWSLAAPDGSDDTVRPYTARHLPQGAPTSPALANLSAFSLDVRLTGMARCFGAAYTRYADDLTFSGSQRLIRALPTFLPLITQIIQSERFRVKKEKRKVLRNNQRQTITGVVVNAHPNVSRVEFDRLKALLTNCIRYGPSGQNRQHVPDFAAHLRGRIAHVMQLNAHRGAKLMALYERIDWDR